MALNSWRQASDGERIAKAARAVLGANDVAKAFSVDGQTEFLESSAVTGALTADVALASLNDVIKSGNPFGIASTFMTLTNAAMATGKTSGHPNGVFRTRKQIGKSMRGHHTKRTRKHLNVSGLRSRAGGKKALCKCAD